MPMSQEHGVGNLLDVEFAAKGDQVVGDRVGPLQADIGGQLTARV